MPFLMLLSSAPSATPWCFQSSLGAGSVLARAATATTTLGPKPSPNMHANTDRARLCSRSVRQNLLAQSNNSRFPPADFQDLPQLCNDPILISSPMKTSRIPTSFLAIMRSLISFQVMAFIFSLPTTSRVITRLWWWCLTAV